jgi:hypothetical protein
MPFEVMFAGPVPARRTSPLNSRNCKREFKIQYSAPEAVP